MKYDRSGLFFLCLLLLTAFGTPEPCLADRVQWQGYEEGKKIAAESHKKILMYFRTDWCGYCRKMEKTTFEDSKVLSYIKENFVPIKVQGEKETQIASEYGVSGYPHSWFLDQDGEKLRMIRGYIESDVYLKVLEYIDTDSYGKMSFKDFVSQKR